MLDTASLRQLSKFFAARVRRNKGVVVLDIVAKQGNFSVKRVYEKINFGLALF